MANAAKVAELREFYVRNGVDHRGRTLEQILGQSDTWWEEVHDFIQWVFPLPTVSSASADAPAIPLDVFAELACSTVVRANARRAWLRYMQFLGYDVVPDTGMLQPSSNYAERRDDWAVAGTHNDLRITRMLQSLRLLGLPREVDATLMELNGVLIRHRRFGAVRTMQFWQEAARDVPRQPQQE